MNLTKAFSPDFIVVVESLLGKPLPPKESLQVLDTLEKQLQELNYLTLRNSIENVILVKRQTKPTKAP